MHIASKLLLKSVLVLGAVTPLGFPHPASAQTTVSTNQVDFRTSTRNILLVHGAFADGTSYSKVIERLQARGFHVVSVQIPLTSFADDVAATKRAIDLETGPIVLVAHSYAGAVITQAGVDPKVKQLVYLASLVPDIGESALSLLASAPAGPATAEEVADPAGFIKLTNKGYAEDFAEGVPENEIATLEATQVPTSITSLDGVVTEAAWKLKPSWYVITKTDRTVPEVLQKRLALRIDASTIEINSCHLVMRAHPEAVTEVIEAAAAGIRLP